MAKDAEKFISEPITPEKGTFSPELMSSGLAALPAAFTWRNRRFVIAECISHEKISSPEGGRIGNEVYLRRQQFTVRLEGGQIAKIYIERRARPSRRPDSAKQRWFLYTMADSDLP